MHRVGGACAVQGAVGNALHRGGSLAGTGRAFSMPLARCTGRREASLSLPSGGWSYQAPCRIRPRRASRKLFFPLSGGCFLTHPPPSVAPRAHANSEQHSRPPDRMRAILAAVVLRNGFVRADPWRAEAVAAPDRAWSGEAIRGSGRRHRVRRRRRPGSGRPCGRFSTPRPA